MKYYYDHLQKNKFNVKYIEFDKKLPPDDYIFFDPIDKIKLKGTMLESPNFIMTKNMYEKYRKKKINFYLPIFICGVKRNEYISNT